MKRLAHLFAIYRLYRVSHSPMQAIRLMLRPTPF